MIGTNGANEHGLMCYELYRDYGTCLGVWAPTHGTNSLPSGTELISIERISQCSDQNQELSLKKQNLMQTLHHDLSGTRMSLGTSLVILRDDESVDKKN